MTRAHSSDTADQRHDRPELDLMDVLQQRAIAGHPVYVDKSGMDAGTGQAVDKLLATGIAKLHSETGLPAKVVQIVDLGP